MNAEQAIAEIARRHGLIIIEDDVFRLLADNPPPTLQSLAPERVYYVSSLSKTVAPGLRIGMVVTPEGATDALVRQQRVTGGRAAGIMAELARIWIDTGVADRTLAQIKRELAVRREVRSRLWASQSRLFAQAQCSPGCPCPNAGFRPNLQPWPKRGGKNHTGPRLCGRPDRPASGGRLCIGSPPSTASDCVRGSLSSTG